MLTRSRITGNMTRLVLTEDLHRKQMPVYLLRRSANEKDLGETENIIDLPGNVSASTSIIRRVTLHSNASENARQIIFVSSCPPPV